VQKILEEYDDRVRLVIKHYPYRYRDYAFLAAQAAEAARAQGRFWEMHDLMLREKRLTREDLIGYARQLDLDVKRFTRELDKEKYLPRVKKDVEQARELDVYQTPTFVINGRKIVGERPYEKFQEIIEEELAEVEIE
jgi:predicted DsbA family dithiol-disulfide isomerase